MGRSGRVFLFRTVRGSLAEVLANRDLASLGDAYVNFECSLAFSNRRGRPLGVKVKGSVLAEAFREGRAEGLFGFRDVEARARRRGGSVDSLRLAQQPRHFGRVCGDH